MASNLFLNPRFWDDFVVEVDIAVFPRPFSLCNFAADTFPVVFLSILAHAPSFEVPLVLCFAEQK